MSERSLFDDLEPEEPEEWREVPQAVFLSWPRKMQLAYCAARDEDSAQHATSVAELDWYVARAKGYREDMEK